VPVDVKVAKDENSKALKEKADERVRGLSNTYLTPI